MRLGADIPKQYIEVCKRPIISYCIEQLVNHDKIDKIWIVADRAWQAFIADCIKVLPDCAMQKFQGFSLPGENRQLSILHGMADIRRQAADDDYIVIHDAARPLLSAKQITDCLAGVSGHDGLVPVLPMRDTVYASLNGKQISSLLNRSEIFAGQAPEVFLLGKYYEANRKLELKEILKINGATEPAVLAGMDVVMIPGDEENFKITTKMDLQRFRKIMIERI